MASDITLKVQDMTRPGILGPLLLITAGLILLADNLGYVSVSIWSVLWDYWPVVLILIGLDVIVSHTESRVHYILGVLAGLVIIAVVLSLVLSEPAPEKEDDSLRARYTSGRFLLGSNMNGMDLEGRDFSDTLLIGVNMQNSNLHDADLSDSVLIGANMQMANLSGADLSDSVLIGANFNGADMCGADIEGVILVGTDIKSPTTCTD